MTKLNFVLIIIAVFLMSKAIKEIMYIYLYSFILKLRADGKLMQESNPNSVTKKIEMDLKNNL